MSFMVWVGSSPGAVFLAMSEDEPKNMIASVKTIREHLELIARSYKALPFRILIMEDLRLIKIVEEELQRQSDLTDNKKNSR
ncbi:MAG: hypothetical protein AAFX87_24545 [Bacteroidota bacterium]